MTVWFSVGQAFAGTPSEPNFTDTLFIADATRMGNNPASTDGQVNGITCMAWAPDGADRLYVTVKGRSDANAHIQVIRNGVLQSVPFYTFNTGVETNNECGLMSLVFHPDYASGTKQIYCFLTVSTTEQRVVRFAEIIDGNGNYVASGAPTTIVGNIPTADQNHNGGGLTIAPDQNGNGRFIYWVCGNNGNGTNRGERLDTTNLGAKLGRANLDGSIPSDGLNSSGYIWAYGYRNGFTMTTQPSTGKLWVNVVGDSYEQVFMPTPGSWAGDNDFENGADPSDATLRSKQIVPVVKYRTGGSDSRTLAATNSAVRNAGTVTFTTTSRHGFRKGERITVSGVTPTSFNGNWYVLSTPSDTTFTATVIGTDASGNGGTAATQALGNCITGGAFYDKTVWPTEYRGNFFFGDYGSGRIVRVQLNTDNTVKQVDQFLTGGGRITDVTFGPDGNMYYGVIDTGTIRKVTFSSLTITTASPLPVTTVGASYNQTLAVSGATAPNTWAVIAGALPGGLSLNTSSGAITGTPNAAGTFNFTVRVTDSTSKTGQKDFAITVNAAPSISTTTLPGGNVGVAYNQTLSGSGGTTPRTWSVSIGSLPAGLTLNGSSGAITGTPTTAGTSTFTVSLMDAVGVSTTRQLSIVIATGNTAPQITSTAKTTGNIGVAYSYDVNASGSPAPTYSLTTFPTGMTINTSSGVISWTPSAAGAFNVTVKAANGTAPDATQSFTINVTDYGLDTRAPASVNLGLNTSSLPATLSATNVFSNVGTLTPSAALIPYDVNSPLWSDASSKSRWIAVPNDGAPYAAGETIGFAATGEWTFPVGTVLVKHFELNTDERNPNIKKRLETRLIFVQSGTVFGVTYKWRADGSDADLLPDSVDENITITTATGGSRTQTWHYPSRSECLQCHNQTAGGVLGVKTRQQNGSYRYAATGVTDNQLRTWNHIGMFNPVLNETSIPGYAKLAPLGDNSASLETRVRSYLDSNCSHCHRPAVAPALFDARFDTPLASQNIVNGPVNNTLNVANAKVVAPKDILRSIMHRRTNTTDATIKMPPLARNVIDTQAVSVLEQWIGTLPEGSGMYGVYYDNMDFTGTSITREDPEINFDWGTGSPIAGIGPDTFSVRWTGQIQAQFSETYTLYTRTDDGVRLWVNGQLLVDKWVNQGPTEWSGTIALIAGQKYNVIMEYYENGGGAVAQLSWSSASTPKGTIPQGVMFSVPPPAAPSGLIAVAASDTRIDLTWTDNASSESNFEIERSPDGTNWAPLATVAANTTTYSNTGLTAATTYHYRVRATNFVAASAYSTPASTTTMSGGGGGLPPSGLKINFQPAASPIPSGYYADGGAVFGDRGNGYSYGWNLDNSTTARDRNSTASPDQRYDTLQHLQKPENPNAFWEISLPNGNYSVRVVSGDPSHIDSVYKTNIEGVLSINATPTSTQRWFESTKTVTISDGRLTISNASGAANNKICFVEITSVAVLASRDIGDMPADQVVFDPVNATMVNIVMNKSKNSQAGRIKVDLPNISPDTLLKGQIVGIDIGGAVMEFTLDAKGRAVTKFGRCLVKLNVKKQKATVTISMKGSWTQAWNDGGLESSVKSSLDLPFVLTFNGKSHGGTKPVQFNGKSGRPRR